MRRAGGSGTNPDAAIASGIDDLWGRSHGGANEAVVRMVKEIGSPKNIPTYIEKAKDKSDPFKWMGFGHRVYKNHDPRATIIRQVCHDLLNEIDTVDQPLFDIAMKLEEIALEDDYFIERKLYPNVDFYSGLTYQAMGFPFEMFTVLFAIGRTPGWLAHWDEMLSQDSRIARPRQIYIGSPERDVQPIDKR